MDEKQIPQVRVGIMNEPQLDFVLNGDYRVNGNACGGAQTHDSRINAAPNRNPIRGLTSTACGDAKTHDSQTTQRINSSSQAAF